MSNIKPGEQFHFLVSGFSFLAPPLGMGETSRRAQTVTVTADLIDLNTDRAGECFLALDAEQQVQRYGREIWAEGPAPANLSAWTPGTVEEERAREQARRVAQSIPDDQKRAAALAEVRRQFPLSNPSGQRSSYTPGDTERLAYLRSEGLAS